MDREATTGCDRLFGGREPDVEPARRIRLRHLATAAGAAVLIAAVMIARRPDAVTNPQFWAEDGYIFFYDNLKLGFPQALAKMYRRFPYLTHRLIAFAGGLVPFAFAPRVYTTSAIALTALALATFALPRFRHLVASDALRILFGIVVVSAPYTQEVLSTPTNIGWFVAIWLSLLSLVRLPRAPWRVGLLTLGGALMVPSTPVAIVNLPLWLLRAWWGVRRGMRREVAFALTLVGTLGLVAIVTRGLGAEQDVFARPGLATPSPFVAARHSLAMLTHHAAAFLLPPPTMARVEAAGLVGIAGATALGLLGALALGLGRNVPGCAAVLYLLGAYFVGIILGRPKIHLLFTWGNLPSRYTIFPTAMWALLLVAVLDGLSAGVVRRTATAGLVAMLALTWGSRFVVEPFADRQWPMWAARLEEKLATQSSEPLQIPMNPPYSPLRFDVPIVSQEVRVPAKAILAGLGTHGVFRQDFVSRCDRLTAIEVALTAAAPSTVGAVRLTLVGGNGRIAAQRELPRTQLPLDGSLQRFGFDPIVGSLGQRYAILVAAVQNVVEATVYVLGAHGDPYPDGEAMSGDHAVDGDMSFRYECIRP